MTYRIVDTKTKATIGVVMLPKYHTCQLTLEKPTITVPENEEIPVLGQKTRSTVLLPVDGITIHPTERY